MISSINAAQYQEEVLQSKMPVLVKMSTAWCPPCRAMAPVLQELAERYAGRVKIVEIDGEASVEIAESLRITGYPTMVFFSKGEEVGRILGATPKARIIRFLQENELV